MVAGREKKVKHEQIYETIFNRILSQEYSPGEKMPNEHQLADSFNASRPTIGKALQKLEKNGLIQRKPGAGTFVKQADPSRGQKLGILVPRLSVEPGDFHHFVSLFSVVVSQISRTANHYEHMLLMNDLPSGNDQEIIDHAWTICHQLIGIQVKGVFFLPLELPQNTCMSTPKSRKLWIMPELQLLCLTVIFTKDHNAVNLIWSELTMSAALTS